MTKLTHLQRNTHIQKKGTTFPISIRGIKEHHECDALLDMGATKSCINYTTAIKLGKEKIKTLNTTQVVGVDGSDLGVVGNISCEIQVGNKKLEQSEFELHTLV